MTSDYNEDWENFLKTVKPLKKRKEFSFSDKIKDNTNLGSSSNLKIQKNFKPPIDLDELNISSGENKNNIDKNLLIKIRKGRIKINRTLDLHGFTVKESAQMVFHFIKESFLSSDRLVLIITGKGKRNGSKNGWESDGVLKKKIPIWLTSKILTKYIVWFGLAPKNKGGDGAVLIYIRKLIK